MFLCHKLHLRKLRSPHATRTNITDFSGLDEVMESLHGLFYWDTGVEAMDLEKVDIRGVKAAERGLYGSKDGLAGETWPGVGTLWRQIQHKRHVVMSTHLLD